MQSEKRSRDASVATSDGEIATTNATENATTKIARRNAKKQRARISAVARAGRVARARFQFTSGFSRGSL